MGVSGSRVEFNGRLTYGPPPPLEDIDLINTAETESVPAGVMDASYARGRREAPHLTWRYRVRAYEAVEAFRELATPRRDARVLDLGAAEGLTLLEIRTLLGGEGEYHGVELSDALLAEAPPLPSGVRLVKGDIAAVPAELQAGSYQLATALAVLEHLPDPGACVREAYRMLEPGGVFVATCPNPMWDEIAGALRMVAEEHHEQHLNGPGMVKLLEAAGFEAVTFRPFMWAPVGVIPYAKVPVPLGLAHRIDGIVRRLPLSRFTFVNQLVFGRKPRTG